MQITGEDFASYLACKYQAHLALKGEIGTPCDHDALGFQQRRKLQLSAEATLIEQYSHSPIKRTVVVTSLTLTDMPELILDATGECDPFTFHFNALVRVPGVSSLGPYHYAPALFSDGETIRGHSKLLLALGGFVLRHLQGREPSTGTIIYGEQCKRATVNLTALYQRVAEMLADLRQIALGTAPPQLILTPHCAVCQFRQRCRKEAVATDNLSLLRGMTPKQIAALNQKGIFTVNQLSYTFRPRRRNKRVKKHGWPYSHSLKALAIREQKIYVMNKPSLPSTGTHVFVDMEGDAAGRLVYCVFSAGVRNSGQRGRDAVG